MSKLGSLYIMLGEPEGELSVGCGEIEDWAAQRIEDAESLLRKWCHDAMTADQVKELERQTILFLSGK